MSSINNTYPETFTSIGTDRAITYSLNGYIEQIDNTNSEIHNYVFNMWTLGSPNCNWRRATMTKQLFIK